MRIAAAGLAALALALAAPASAMPVATFLAKIDTLMKEGQLATMTSDAALVKKELQDDAAALRAERLAAVQAGKAPAYCPDAQAAEPTGAEIILGLKQVPQAEQGKIEVKDALRAHLAKRFPCTK
jgi:hypothetical protein